MSDLFTRLAQRALAEAGSSTWTEVAVSPGRDEIQDESSATSTITSPAGSVALESPAAPSLVPHSGRGESARDGRIGRKGDHGLPGALVPVPSVVPAVRDSALRPSARDGAPQRVPTESVSAAPDQDARQVEQRERPVDRGRFVVPPLRNAPSVEPDPPVARERHDPAPVPDVEVSVGRIEIRVRPPAAERGVASDRTAKGPTPAMPLDEYLRRREESA